MNRARNNYELDLMRKSGQITARALKAVIESARPGMNLLELEKIGAQTIQNLGGELSFTTVEDYQWASCLTVNEELVHGIPRDIILNDGDILGIDIGAIYRGWHTDAAWSVLVTDQAKKRSAHDKRSRFLAVGEEALWKAIKQARSGNKIGDISFQIESTVEDAGYSVSESLVGHGVGRQLHEDPIVPGLGRKNTGLKLIKNMTIAIEVIYAEGSADVELASDGWTYITKDKSLGGLFEMSVIVLDGQAEVLTDWRKY